MEFAQQLRSLSEVKGLSVRALANLVGVSKVTIWKWERGDSVPRTRLIVPLAKALAVSPVQLGLSGEVAGQLSEQMEAVGQDEAETPPANQGESLSEVIARAKQMIADASGVGPRNITISIEY
jgi:transcriptional regulator with XRE-family HTH domain